MYDCAGDIYHKILYTCIRRTGTGIESVPPVKMKENTKSGQTIWNGAEQLFQAAKDYGITICFANPGEFCILVTVGNFTGLS